MSKSWDSREFNKSDITHIDNLARAGLLHYEIFTSLLVFELISLRRLNALEHIHVNHGIDITIPHGDFNGKDRIPLIFALSSGNFRIGYWLHKLNPQLTASLLNSMNETEPAFENIHQLDKLDNLHNDIIVLLQIFKLLENVTVVDVTDHILNFMASLKSVAVTNYMLDFIGTMSIGVDLRDVMDNLLLVTSEHGQLDRVKLLIERGADIHFRNNEVMQIAVRNGNLGLLKYIYSTGAIGGELLNEAIYLAVRNGRLEVFKYLHSIGAVINEELLNRASCEGHIDIVSYLIEHGVEASIDTLNNVPHRDIEMYNYIGRAIYGREEWDRWIEEIRQIEDEDGLIDMMIDDERDLFNQ